MNTMKICSGCPKPLEASAPDGLCLECLLKAGLGTGVDMGPDSQVEIGQTPFVAPSVEEVARLFPQVEILGFIGHGGMGAFCREWRRPARRMLRMATRSLQLAVCLCFIQLWAAAAGGQSAAFSGRIVEESGQPIPAARVIVDLIYHPHDSIMIFDEWRQRWELTSDSQGRYVASGVPLGPNSDRLWVNVFASADGFVDQVSSPSKDGPYLRLNRLLSADRSTADAGELRLLRGVTIQGRVLRADGKPVPEANLFAIGATAQGAKQPGVSGGLLTHRLRRTDQRGQFSFAVNPKMGIDLVVQSDHWAAKRLFVPAGQTDIGDIQLERGTSIQGMLSDEQGNGLSGYWVVAEGLDVGFFQSALNRITVMAKTDATGRFSLSPLSGRFSVRVPDSFWPWRSEPRLHSPKPKLAILPEQVNLDGQRPYVELNLRAAPQVRVSGRLLGLDVGPAVGAAVEIHCNVKNPGTEVALDIALADENGDYAFQGIPNGIKEVAIAASGLRYWKPNEQLFLKMKPSADVAGARPDGQVYLDEITRDLTNISFQFQPWKAGKGFVPQAPDQTERPETKGSEPRKTPTKAAGTEGTSPAPEEQFEWLELEYQRKLTTFVEEERTNRSPASSVQGVKFPAAEYAPKFLALAEAYPRSEAAFRALSWICQNMPSGPPSLLPQSGSNILQLTVKRLERDHLQSTNFTDQILQRISALGETEAEGLLRQLAETNPHREVRGQALYHLAKRLARAAEDKPSADGEQRIVTLFQRVTNDFASLPHWRGTLGEAAARDLYEIQNLGVGKLAPEIIGTDADGAEFKLSDHRGNIVVLIFSGEWCVPCRAQQPRLRALQAVFRDKPVRLLGVMSDPPERLRQAVRKGDITWPCWCDHDHSSGPITTQWNINSWPTMHLVDQDGVIRQRNVSVGQLQGVLEKLLQEQGQRPTRSGAAPSPRH